jgi:serine/threonine protein phosphatase PrpC
MPEEKTKLLWDVIGATVQGATHVRAGLKNQDSIDWQPKDQKSSTVWMAVSDGHGSAKSFRSDIGSELATKTALDVLQKFTASVKSDTDSQKIKAVAQETLPKSFVRSWLREVEAHWNKSPFEAEETEKLGTANRETAYGATLVTVLVTESYILYLQLGDGDILVVDEEGEVSRPLQADERLFANETTSLCLPKAWDDFRFRFQRLAERPPVLILVATDGYSNSFRDEPSFKKVGSDIFAMMREEGGAATVKANLESWLQEATKRGSGDDISVGIIYRDLPLRSSLPSKKDPESEKEKKEETPQSPVEVVPESPVNMNGSVPEKLRAIIALDILEDSIRRKGMLRDVFNEKRQVSVLVNSLDQRIPQKLKALNGPPSLKDMNELADRLQKNVGLSEENARWAVQAWTEAIHPDYVLPQAEHLHDFQSQGANRLVSDSGDSDSASKIEESHIPAADPIEVMEKTVRYAAGSPQTPKPVRRFWRWFGF